MIKYSKDLNNIVTLRLDMAGRKVNIINHQIIQAFIPVLEHLKKEKLKGQVKGVILTSDKSTFLAGGDLDYLYHGDNAQEIFEFSEKVKRFFKELENPGIPVVAALNGSAIGSGFEMALACHCRIMIDRADVHIRLPEVSFGLIPGSGGITRLLWMLGIEKAFPLLIEGKTYSAKDAKRLGLINDIAKNEDELVAKAKKWILNNRNAAQPWDDPNHHIPGGTPDNIGVAKMVGKMTAQLFKKTQGKFPAPHALLNTLVEASKVDFKTAGKIESRIFTELVLSQESKNMIKTFWQDSNNIIDGLSRPKGFGKFRPKKVGVIGSGAIGSGIALVCAQHDMEVILKDISKAIAERCKKTIELSLDKMLKNFECTVEQKDLWLSRIQASENASDFKDCDIVIEAVFESQNIKAKVTKDAAPFIDEYTLFGSTTSLISITELAKAAERPSHFIGIRFQSPVLQRPIVEIIKGKATSEESVARAYDFVRQLEKLPIIVKDSPGFYAARVQNVYILEGIALLQEGYPATVIEQMGLQSGMPKGPLSWADELSLNVVIGAERQAAEHYGKKYVIHPAVETLNCIIEDHNRSGKFNGSGFYDYKDGKKEKIWEDLNQLFPTPNKSKDYEALEERYLFAQALEAVWCFQEGIIPTVAEANLASVYSWGFPAFKGGVLQYINSYGLNKFIQRADQLKAEHGKRFSSPKLLRVLAKEGKLF